MAGVLVVVVGALALALAAVVAVLVVLVRGHRARLAALEARLAARDAEAQPTVEPAATSVPLDVEPANYLITRVGEPEPDPRTRPAATAAPAAPARVDTALFTDLLVKETAVQAVALAHGVRRALAPEHRHRIRFHVRQEVKRARKQRRAEMRIAHREWAARQRLAAAPDDRVSGGSAA